MNQHEPIHFTVPSGDTKRARILLKGGGGGGDGGAAAREADRQARIQAGTDQVNAIFGVGNLKSKVPTGEKRLTGYSRTVKEPGIVGANQAQEIIDPTKYNQLVSSQNNDSVFGGSEQSNPSMFRSGYGGSQAVSGGDNGVSFDQPVATVDPNQYSPIYEDVMTEVESPASLAAQQRTAMYDGLREDTRKFYSSQLEQDRAKAQRELGFQKARQGIIGSSQANDMDTQFQQANDRGLLDVANRADNAATQFRTADEQARLNLITKVVAGLDQGTAAQNAASTLQTNQNAAKEAYQSQRMSNVFADLLGSYNQGQYMAGTNQAKAQGTNQYGNYTPAAEGVSGDITKNR